MQLKHLPLVCLGVAAVGAMAAVTLDKFQEASLLPGNGLAHNASTEKVIYSLGQKNTLPMRAQGDVYNVPVTFSPTNEFFQECTVLDLNEDGKKWQIKDHEGENYFTYQYGNEDADDWLIFPGMNLTAGSYKITTDYHTRNYPENFKLCIGNDVTPESMSVEVFRRENYNNSTPVTESFTVEIPASGVWHLGLYAYSEANKFYIYVGEISVEKLDPSQPKAPEFTIESNGLESKLMFTTPSTTLGGDAITADEVKIYSTWDGEELLDPYIAAPGSEQTIEFEAPDFGEHTVTLRASVVVDGNELFSEPASLTRKFTKIQPVPTPMGYTFFPDEDEFAWCTVIDNNNDGNTWSYSNSGYPSVHKYDGAFRYSPSWTKSADEYIILPAFDGSVGGAKRLTFDVGTKYYDEALEVCVATEPTVEALSQNVVWSRDKIQSPEKFEEQEAIFPTAAGQNFYVAFHMVSPSNRGYFWVQNIHIDLFDGTAPAAGSFGEPVFDGGEGVIPFTFPTHDLNGEAIPEDTKVYVNLSLDGTEYGEPLEGAPGETKEIAFSGLELGNHTVEGVTQIEKDGAMIGDRKSSVSFKVRISSSFSYTLPVDLNLNQDVYDNFLVVNVNNDDKTWQADAEQFVYSYGSTAADDWFISPAVEIPDVTKRLEFSITAKVQSGSYPEKFEVFIGREQSVAGMTECVLPLQEIKNTDFSEFASNFALSEPGRYYIGVRCCSKANQYRLYVKNMKLAVSDVPNTAPSRPTDLEGDGLVTGELKARVSFRFPVTDLGGNALDPEKMYKATVTGTQDSWTISGKPGSAASVVLDCPEGESPVTVVVTDEEGLGDKASVMVRCGLDRPTNPKLVSYVISEDNRSVKIDWEAIVTGVTGNHVNPDNMDYYLWEYDEYDEDWYQVDVTSDLTLTYELNNPNEPLSMITLGLQAYNGFNSGSGITAFTVMLGKPLEMPLKDDFANGRLSVGPVGISSSLSGEYAPTWHIGDPGEVNDAIAAEEGDYALIGHTAFNRGDSYIHFPKFSTVDKEAAEFEFSSYDHPASAKLTLLGTCYGQEEDIVLGEVGIPSSTDGWKKHVFQLPAELLGKQWVDMRLHVDFIGGSTCQPMFDSWSVREPAGSALSTVEAAATSIKGGEGGILFTGFSGKTAAVYTPAGMQAAGALITADSQQINVAPGIYVVTVGDTTAKVAVR